MRPCLPALLILLFGSTTMPAQTLQHVEVSQDGKHFMLNSTGQRFVVWGVNYDHDHQGRLLDEYWHADWSTVVEDFKEIKALGANCVRIHLQLGLFMDSPDQPNQSSLDQLSRVVKLAEETGLYLDVTGLACYHKQNIPDWFDQLDESQRWNVQARFWEAVAETCHHSPAIFCYDLMNEPILPGKESADEWLTGELSGKFFVQRLALDLKGRQREELAEAWVAKMVQAIRRHDQRHMITVGVIPWVFVFGGGKPLFYSPPVANHLDFVAVHFYPETDQVDKALAALKAYEVGKPLLIEEMFPLKCSQQDLIRFVRESSEIADGWISFYWGQTPQQLRQRPESGLAEAITANWLEAYQKFSADPILKP